MTLLGLLSNSVTVFASSYRPRDGDGALCSRRRGPKKGSMGQGTVSASYQRQEGGETKEIL